MEHPRSITPPAGTGFRPASRDEGAREEGE
jgi:hypothetical protein